MNEILKFKQGRMIPKAQGGLRFVEAGTTTMGNKVWADATTGDLYEFNLDPNDAKYVSRFKPGMRGHLGKSYNFYNLFTGRGTINGADYIRKQAAKPAVDPRNDPKVLKYLARLEKQGFTARPTGAVLDNTRVSRRTAGVQRRVGTDWNGQYQSFLNNMTDDQKAWLAQRGIDYGSAQQMQTYLANHGQDLGKWGADGKWGSTSQAAWDNFVATTMKNNPLQTPVRDPQPAVEPVVDAADPFGYKTSNHYGDGFALKNMGFSNYAGLQKFAMGDDQFAKDLRERFGQDVNQWDQAAVEGALNVSGRYRGGRSGDFGDMARSMQDWAAKKNAAYDQKELASRTGASGTVYSSPEMMRKFESVLVKPNKLEFLNPMSHPPMYYSNTGASILGNQPGLIKQDQWADGIA